MENIENTNHLLEHAFWKKKKGNKSKIENDPTWKKEHFENKSRSHFEKNNQN